ncbi:MAG: alpha/beta hydrolase [Ruminococcus sp.]|nr:alpha/beta hydrolase [Ruminococcus sp.]
MSLHTKTKSYVKRVLSTLLVVILSFCIVSMVAASLFFHSFFPRRDTLPAYSMRYDDIDASRYPCRRIQFPSGENTLTGYCYTCEEPAGLVVIAAGFGESGAAHLPEMMYFADSGYDVLCYDGTGIGESEGTGTVGLSQPALDLRSALDAVADDPALNQLPIYLYGHSAGGYAVATCSILPSVKAAVILSGFESPTMLMRETARNYVGILADIEYPFLSLENSLVFSGRGSQSASQCIYEAGKPVAVFEGSDDSTIPEAVRLSAFLSDSDNPDLSLTILSDPLHSGHSGLWLSDEALDYRLASTDEVSDPVTANELDGDFMDDIVQFYKNSGI